MARALNVYKKFPVTAQASFKKAIKALQEWFEPGSRRDLYLAKFQTRHKVKTESWPEFVEDLVALVDKAYPLLDDEAQQVSFSVKQGKPMTVEAAVSATLECESYLIKPPMSCGAVTPAQVESKDSRTMMDMMMQLMSWMEKLEEKSFQQQPSVRKGSTGRRPDQVITWEQREVVCYRCRQEGHFARGCARPKKSAN